MKKIFFTSVFSLLMFFALPVRADFYLFSAKQLNYYGEGVLNMPDKYTIYSKPDKNSEIIREINYEAAKKSAVVRSTKVKEIFYITHIPSADIALLAVDMNEENGWYKVFIDQKTGETGWVYVDSADAFYTYKKLFYKFGKKYGVRMFNDLSEDKKVLYAKQSETSKKLDQLVYPKFMTFIVISGNWMLVKAKDGSKHAKTGWFKWREDDGTLNMFPNFKE